ncbi:MAG: D-alanyl-D-alanine carboxypeptidase [Alphaproteobacteria bacterium]|nr:D-alanyl-D-alanine carboxypeptidase [Alphaproteobacteria bacterium]
MVLITTCVNAADFSTRAKSVYLIDYDSDKEIVSKNSDVLMPPSSMLKLMTLSVLFDEIKANKIKLEDTIEASENSDFKNPLWYPASKMCLVSGQKITVKDAILGIIVLSAGDACVAVAEKIAGSENKFTELMQKKAQEIGMPMSQFGNSSGLPNENNLMTSKELAVLAKYIISEYPDLYPMFSTKRFEFQDAKTDWCREWNKTHTMNYNKLLFSMRSADGLKTGHTNEGGYGMVASAKIGGRRLIGVINGFNGNGHDALAEEMKKLLNYGFSTTQTKVFSHKNESLFKIPVWYGRYETIDATTNENIALTISNKDSFKDVRVLARYDSPLIAPVKKGQNIGEIIIEKNGNPVKRIPLIAKDNDRKIQFIGRIFKNISVMIWGR